MIPEGYIVGTMTVGSMLFCFLIGTALVLMGAYSMIQIGTTHTVRAIVICVFLFAFDVYMFYGIYEICSAVFMRGHFTSNIGTLLGNMPYQYRVFLMLVLLAIGLLRMDWVMRTLKNTLTQFSVGETLDLIPLGIAFSNDFGQVMQTNKMMDELSFKLTGSIFSEENAFWDKITSGNIIGGTLVTRGDLLDLAAAMSGGEVSKDTGTVSAGSYIPETPVIKMDDGSIWLFSRTKIASDIGLVSQILAVDATKEEKISQELRESNKQLREMNQRLRRYHEEVDDTVRSEELLEAKMRVHDKMGETLIAAKMYLTNPDSPVDAEDVLRSWKEDLALLREESKGEEAPKQIQRLMDAATHLGVDLQIVGEMPENHDVMNLICVGIQECMTNAIQHAEASRLIVNIGKDDYMYHVNYSNNGKAPSFPIKEGGGLKLLRETANKMNATMYYDEGDIFSLNLRIPRPDNDF